MECRIIKTILLVLCSLPVLSVSGQQVDSTCTGYSAPYKASLIGLPGANALTKEAILNAGGLQSSHPAFEIVNFTIGSSAGCIYMTATCNSNLFDEKTIHIIKASRPGDFLLFDCIRVKNKAGRYFILKQFAIKIVAANSNPVDSTDSKAIEGRILLLAKPSLPKTNNLLTRWVNISYRRKTNFH